MKCALCGLEFAEKDGAAACGGCVLAGGCSLVRCPNCGYETPREPESLRKLKRRLGAWKSRKKPRRR